MTGGVMDAKETLERLADWWELPGGDEESQRLRAAAIRFVLEDNERLREIVSLYSGPAYAALLEENDRLKAALEDMKKRHRPIRIWPVCECLGCEALKGEK